MPGQSGPGNNANEGVLHTPLNCSLMSHPEHPSAEDTISIF